MKKGDRVQYQGQPGTVVEAQQVTPGMIDIRFDDGYVRRAPRAQVARTNPRKPPEFLGMGRRIDEFKAPLERRRVAKEPKEKDPVEAALEELAEIREALGILFDPAATIKKYQDRYGEDWEKKLLQWAKVRIKKEGNLLKNKREALRVAKLKGVPDERVRGDLATAMQGPGVGVFTRPDPPRFASDGQTFCGNAIDGTAYFIAVSNKRKGLSRFVRWEPLVQTALAERAVLPSFDFALEPTKLQSSTTRATIVDKALENWFAQYDLDPATAQVIRDLVDQGLTLRLSNGRHLTLAGVEVQVAPSVFEPVRKGFGSADALKKAIKEALEEGDYPRAEALQAQEDEKVGRMAAGEVVQVIVPTPEFIDAIVDYYDSTYKTRFESQGFKVFEVRRKPGSYMYLRGGKKRSKRAKGPRPEDIATRAKPSARTSDPIPGLDFAIPDENALLYARMRRDIAPSVEKFRNFQPFGIRSQGKSEGWHTWKNTTGMRIPARDALVQLSANPETPPMVSEDVADLLFESSLVFISDSQKNVVVARPGRVVEPGMSLHVWDQEKAGNPYFSWVRSITTSEPRRGQPYEKCLTPVEADAYNLSLQALKSVRALKNRFGSIQRTVNALRMRDNATIDPDKLLVRLVRGYSNLERRQIELELTEGPAADIAARILADNPLRVGVPGSLLDQGVEKLAQMGLIEFYGQGEDENVRPLVSENQIADFYRSYFQLLMAQPGPGRDLLAFLSGQPVGGASGIMQQALLDAGLQPSQMTDPGTRHPLEDYHEALVEAGVTTDAATFKRLSADLKALLYRRPPRTNQEKDAWEYGTIIRRMVLANMRGEQRDKHDALTLMGTDAFRIRQMNDRAEVLPPVDQKLLKMVLIVHLYFDLGGYQLAGPLAGGTGKTLFQTGIQAIDKELAELIGGKALGSTPVEQYTVYKTYNPVLFEMTRLYWPGYAADRRWRGFLTQPEKLLDVDTVGRYGVAASLMQQAILRTDTRAGVASLLSGFITTPTQQYAEGANLTDFRLGSLPLGVDFFALLWPLGLDYPNAIADVAYWTSNPFLGLSEMKEEASTAAPRLLAVKQAGLAPPRQTLLSMQAAKDILTGAAPALDPKKKEDDPARIILRNKVKDLIGAGARSVKAEVKALKDFQKNPGSVRVRGKDGLLDSKKLKPVRASGVYDAPTIKLLIEKELSAKRPPGEEEFAGQTNTPWVARPSSGPDLQKSSMLQSVQVRARGLKNWIARIDELLGQLGPELP